MSGNDVNEPAVAASVDRQPRSEAEDNWWRRMVQKPLEDCKHLPPAVLQRLLVNLAALSISSSSSSSTDDQDRGPPVAVQPDGSSSTDLPPLEQLEWWMRHHMVICADSNDAKKRSASWKLLGTLFQAIDTEIEKIGNALDDGQIQMLEQPPQLEEQQRPPIESRTTAVLGFLDLEGEPMQQVLSFLTFKDLLQKAEACKILRKDVEALCLDQLKIIKNHAYNDADRRDFDARIGDQTNIDTSATKRSKPVHLPMRYLRWAAARKHVRKIAVYPRDNDSIGSMAVSPSGNRIAFRIVFPIEQADESKVEIWDLATNTNLATIQARVRSGSIVFLDEDRIAFSTIDADEVEFWTDGYECWTENEISGLWSLSGRLTTAGNDPRYKFYGGPLFPKSPNEIFVAVCFTTGPFITSEKFVKVFSVDITRNSSVSEWEDSMFTLNPGSTFLYGDCKILGVCGRWMILTAGNVPLVQMQNGSGPVGLYVVDLQTKSEHHYWNEGEIWSVKLSSECSKTLCMRVCRSPDGSSYRNHRCCILKLDEATGRLSEISSFPMLDIGSTILAVSKTQFFVYESRRVRGFSAYNLQTGELERFMPNNHDFSFPEDAISSGRNELIVAYNHRGGNEIVAFCLREPII